MARIPKAEFIRRINVLRDEMARQGVDAVFVFGDEYRKENVRYASNYWPIFERSGVLIGKSGEPVTLCAPEGEKVALEMSVWQKLRVLKDFSCVTVPDEVDYPLTQYTALADLYLELRKSQEIKRLGIVGIGDMPANFLNKLSSAFQDAEVVDFGAAFFKIRLIKSPVEIECLRTAARMADIGFEELMKYAVPGNTELFAAAMGECAARAAGAEQIIFTLFGSGERTNTIVGRPSEKVIQDGDMVMAALAVQYEGYVATVELPFVAGKMTEQQKKTIDALVEAETEALKMLKPAVPMKNLVIAVRDLFRKRGLDRYDVYPPLHGCGCAEAESPYPHERTEELFLPGMTVNFDISLFGCAGGSNRIEECFVITESGAEPMSALARRFYAQWRAANGI